MPPETLLQRDMFSGKMVDNRTAAQKQADHERDIPMQQEMFSIQETVQIGVNMRPWLSETSRPSLELVSEDPRSEEEIERDLMRGAEALTANLFADMPQPNGEDEREGEELETEDGQEPQQKPVESGKVTKYSAYSALVALTREQAVTLWVDDTYRQRYYNQLPLSIQAAQGVGLTATEISTAMQIGEFLGSRERQAAGSTSHVIYEANSANGSPSTEATNSKPAPAISDVEKYEGLRAHLRGEGIAISKRQPKSKIPEIVPIE